MAPGDTYDPLGILSAVFEQAGSGLCLAGPDGTVLRANAEWLRFAGLSRERAVGRQVLALLPDEREALAPLFARAQRGETVALPRLPRLLGDHETYWDGTAGPAPVEGGTGLLLGVRDVTADFWRERSDARLRDSEDRYRSVVEAMSEGVVVHAADGTIVACNAAAERILGLTGGQLIGRTVDDPIFRHLGAAGEPLAPGEHPALGTLATAVPCQGLSLGVEVDGRGARWLSLNAQPLLREGERTPYGVVTTFTDVTEARRQAAAARDAERHYRSLWELAPVGFVLSDAGGRILAFNRHAHDQLGYARDEFARLTMADIDAVDVDGDFEARVAEIQEGGTLEFETRHRTRAGELRETLVRSRLVQDAGALRVLSVWDDVTEQHRSRRALEESERWLRESERVSRVGHYVFHIEADAWTSSEVLDEIFGIDDAYRRDAAGWLDVVHPEDRPAMAQDLVDMVGRGLRFDREYRVVSHRSGEVRWVHGVGDLLRDEHGRATRMFGTIQDVTRRRRAEQALRESEARLSKSEERYRLLADHANDVIWTLDLRTRRFTYVSPSIFRLRGLTVEEALAEPLERALTPESLARAVEYFARVGTPGEEDPHTGIYDQPCRDGTVRRVEMTITLVRDQDFVPVEAVGVSRDATARLEAEEALRCSEQRFRTLIERSTDMIVLTDAEGRIGFWSPSATEALGWPQDEVAGTELFALVHPGDQDRSSAFLGSLLAEPGATARVTFRARHKNGAWRTLDATCRNLLHDPAVGVVVLNVRDVTDRLRLEEQFRQAQKLESVGRLAGGVAHDFNNLLTVILSCSEALRQDLTDLPPVAREDLDEIHAAGIRARDLTRQLLAFARKQVVAPVRLDVSAVVKGSEKLLRRVLGENIQLKVDVAAGLWPVQADPGQVEQVLLNLAVNARDAMPHGGKLEIATRNVSIGAEEAAACPEAKAGEWVGLVVKDDGAGMGAEVKAHLFEPFFTTKERGQGTGLGLATVHGITAQAGGLIRVHSEPGAGTTFEILFPRASAAPPPEPPPPPPARPARGHDTVLVIEDDAHVRGITVRALRDAGYTVLVASDGGEALKVADVQLGHVDLVVTDVVMPGLSGRAVVQELQRRQPALRALFVSGYTQDAIAQREVVEAGLQFLPKPFTASSLLSRVRQVLDGV